MMGWHFVQCIRQGERNMALRTSIVWDVNLLISALPSFNWYHMSYIASQITNNLTFCSAAYSGWYKKVELLAIQEGNLMMVISAKIPNLIKREYVITMKIPINSLAPGRFQFNFRKVILNGGWGISFEIAIRLMPWDLSVQITIQCWLVLRTSWTCKALVPTRSPLVQKLGIWTE